MPYDGAPHKRRNDWRPTFTESCWFALIQGFLLFIMVWSGYKKGEPGLFFPRPIREVWWYLPISVAFAFGFIQMLRLLDWAKKRPWPYWVASVVVLIVVGFLMVLLLGLF